MLVQVIGIVFVGVLVYTIFNYIKHLLILNRYPNGPFPLPIIGNAHLFFHGHRFEVLATCSREYGDVFGFSLGMARHVVVNSISTAREALVSKGNDFSGRPTVHTFSLQSRNYKGILFADYGPEYSFSRKCGHKALKIYGECAETLEDKINLEAVSMMDRLREAGGKPVLVREMMEVSVFNVICSMLFGKRYTPDHPDFIEGIKSIQYVASSNPVDISNILPASLWFYESPNYKQLKEGIAIRDRFLRIWLTEHKETYSSNQTRDFCDALIRSFEEEENLWKGYDTETEEVQDCMEMILSDMIGAGTETTTTILSWAVLYILHWPHLQDELYEEISSVIGASRCTRLEDRSSLPLCQAFILETLRLSSTVHLVGHKATKTSSIAGYPISKGTDVLLNIWAINNDPREWVDPHLFNLHRWIDSEGNCVSTHDRSYLPFSAGRRVCLGEQMAKNELFIFFTRLVRTFRIQPNEENIFPNFKEGNVGIVFSPREFSVVFTLR